MVAGANWLATLVSQATITAGEAGNAPPCCTKYRTSLAFSLRVEAARDQLQQAFAALPEGAWTEVTVQIEAPEPNLERLVRDMAAGRVELLKILAVLPEESLAAQAAKHVTLQDLQPREVFRQLLTEKNLDDPELLEVFVELVALHEAAALA